MKTYAEMTNAEKQDALKANPGLFWILLIKKLVFVALGVVGFCLILKAIRKSG